MNKHYRFLVYLFILLAWAAPASCNFFSAQEVPTPTSDAIYTQSAQTVEAALTQSAATFPMQPLPDTPVVPGTSSPDSSPLATPTLETTVVQTAEQTVPPTMDDASIAQTPSPPAETAPPAGTPVLEDDFSRRVGWHIDENDDFGFEFSDEGYRMYVNLIDAAIWSVRNLEYADVILEVDAARTGGPVSGYYGLTCRNQDGANYYALVIGSDGSYAIARNLDGEFEFLQEGVAQAGVIRDGNEANRLRADCTGQTLVLYANGQRLAEVQDGSFDIGDVGLVAGTRSEEGLEVLFDNFAVYEP
jgi:hypothetical protein